MKKSKETWQIGFWGGRVQVYKGKFRPYQRINLPNQVTGYVRNDHTNFKVLEKSKSKHKNYNKYFLRRANIYKRNSFLKKHKQIRWIKSKADSFDNGSLFFFKKNRWNLYQKAAPYHYSEKYIPKSSWKADLYSEDVSILKKEWLGLLKVFYKKRLSDFIESKERFNLRKVIRGQRFPEKYKFLFPIFTPEKLCAAKFLFTWKTALQKNRQAFSKRIRRNFSIGYKPIKKRTYLISSTSKTWKRLAEKSIQKYLGNKTIGDLRYLSARTKIDLFSKNTSGFKMKLDTNLELMISNIIYKLKIAPSQYIASAFVRSGFVTVNGKIPINPNSKVHPYDIIKYKGDWFRNYLITILHDEDKSFERFPKGIFNKNSLRFMSRFWPPSYLELNFKLQEAVVLRKSFSYEQNTPYVMRRSNIPTFLRTRFEKKGMGLF